MKKLFSGMILSMAIILITSGSALAAERILFDFEKDTEGWGVPEWCFDKPDYVCKTATTSKDVASHGSSSLMLEVELPGPMWHAGVVECDECEFDLSKYSTISCDFYLPKNAPHGISAKLVLTVSENKEWKWTETANGIDLQPGQWVTLTANLKPSSKDWMRLRSPEEAQTNSNNPKITGAYILDVTDAFRAKVKKIDVRVESDKVDYKGKIYIDNIRVAE